VTVPFIADPARQSRCRTTSPDSAVTASTSPRSLTIAQTFPTAAGCLWSISDSRYWSTGGISAVAAAYRKTRHKLTRRLQVIP